MVESGTVPILSSGRAAYTLLNKDRVTKLDDKI